ncbi:hypothetical protein N0B31_02605 [Salinirubellus salinus]|uniref:Uncharacterized protein n=1 Tax=Salinirubellus salinus TaxID=1364945 RepID=A0A9E7R476_9EURY|nr:hypothetical protein [Salinirubellus salinus]UWM55181.1 hypothetical protein N0B31_02605 [Salinirubellus salinus]
MRSRAVESVVGFVLVFSLVASSVGVVYVFGYGGLQDTRDAEQLSNVESAFDVLADNVEDVQREDAPHRATEFKLYRADLRTGDPVEFTVTVQNWNDDGDPDTAEPLNSTVTVDAVPVVYSPTGSETSIRYVGGAVLRTDRNGAVMLHEPPLVLREADGERGAVFPFVETRTRGTTAVSGSTTVLVRADEVLAESLTAATDPAADTTDTTGDVYDVLLTVETDPARTSTWAEHLNGEFEAAYGVRPCTTAGGTVTCDFETDRLFVSVTRIDVSIDD